MAMQFEHEARMEVGQALLRLPFSLSGSYAMAVRLAPQIVLTESDPLRFLVHEKDIQGAAVKLALYWSTRHGCFGERAFLPMNPPSGMGALTHQDIAALRESCMQQLPDDNHGQAVYIIKASTIASSLTSSGTRVLFYQLHLSKNETGCILLLVVDDASDNTDTSALADLKAFFGILSAMVCKALPLKVIRVLVISSPSTTAPARSMHSVCVQQLIVQNSLSTQVLLINEHSPQELVDKLESFGLNKASLPSVLGGTFGSMPPPAAMMASRFSLDHPQYEESYHLNAAHGTSYASAPPSQAEESSASCSSSTGIQEKEGKASRAPPPALKRRVTSSSQEQGPNRKIKASSRTKNKASSQPAPQDDSATRTASLPRQQAAIVDNKAKTKETEDRRLLKERNALYSRRKYERKKIEIEVMKKEADRHRLQNANLLQEQKRLEQLYAKAMKCIKKHEHDDRKSVKVQGMMQQQLPNHASILAAAPREFPPPPSHSASQPHASILAAAAASAAASAASYGSPSPPGKHQVQMTYSASSSSHNLSELGALRNQQGMLNFQEWLGADCGSTFGTPPKTNSNL